MPIGSYIVDFACLRRKLVIEVDGGQHLGSEEDASRDRWLKEQGYGVLRFWNHEVLKNTEGVLEVIAAKLGAGRKGEAPEEREKTKEDEAASGGCT